MQHSRQQGRQKVLGILIAPPTKPRRPINAANRGQSDDEVLTGLATHCYLPQRMLRSSKALQEATAFQELSTHHGHAGPARSTGLEVNTGACGNGKRRCTDSSRPCEEHRKEHRGEAEGTQTTGKQAGECDMHPNK